MAEHQTLLKKRNLECAQPSEIYYYNLNFNHFAASILKMIIFLVRHGRDPECSVYKFLSKTYILEVIRDDSNFRVPARQQRLDMPQIWYRKNRCRDLDIIQCKASSISYK